MTCDGFARSIECGFKHDGFGVACNLIVHQLDAAGVVDVCVVPFAVGVDIESDFEVAAFERLAFGQL